MEIELHIHVYVQMYNIGKFANSCCWTEDFYYLFSDWSYIIYTCMMCVRDVYICKISTEINIFFNGTTKVGLQVTQNYNVRHNIEIYY